MAQGDPWPELSDGDERVRPFRRDGLLRRTGPFLAVTLVTFVLAAAPPSPSGDAFAASLVLFAFIVVAVVLVPWDRLPWWTDTLPPLAFMVVVALLRDSQGGAVSGYSGLLLLPVVWLALYGRTAQVVVAVAGVALAVLTPLAVIGGGHYPSSEWRRAVVMAGVAALLGWAVFSTVEILRRSAREVALVQRLSTELGRLQRPDQVIDILLGAVADFGSAVPTNRQAELLLVDGDLAEVTADLRVPGPTRVGTVVRLDDDPHLARVARDLVAQGGPEWAYLPLVVNGEVYGIVGVTGPRQPFGSQLVAQMATLVNVGGIALANALAHAQIAHENVVLHEVAERDPLTGAPNRRMWDSSLAAIEAATARTGESVDVGIIDLDRFKQYNDTFGHAAGDQLLRDTIRGWAGVLRPSDLLARLGGEEFGFVLVAEPPRVAAQLADRLRSTMPAGVTCSIGLARRLPDEPLTETLGRADIALYRAKTEGRDLVVQATN